MQNIVAAIAAETLAASLPFGWSAFNWTFSASSGNGRFLPLETVRFNSSAKDPPNK
jgi:hypothetical protein